MLDLYRIEKNRCNSLESSRALEWLVTNGRGGYAMASVNQMLTRRYHGLLVAAIDPPTERYVLLAKLEATAIVSGLTYELGTNDYPEVVHPHGYKLLESFTLRPQPTWLWRAGSALIEQTLCMVEGEDTTFVRFRLMEGAESVQLSVRPLCCSRHYHHLASYHDVGPPTVDETGERLAFQWSGGRPSWQLSHNGEYRSRSDWYYRFVLPVEASRGQDHQQDLFTPGYINATLRRDDETGLVFCASTRNRPWSLWKGAFERARIREGSRDDWDSSNDRLARSLYQASEDFLVHRGNESARTVLAGYPWFTDWGRDTFIALPGLCLVTGRYADARSVLETFARHVSAGMIPNRFPDYGEPPAYNTADASLWYVHAIDRYLTYSGDWSFVAERLYSVVTEILDCHERGTRHGIRADEDGLLFAGEPGYALTWMDACVHGRAVTPRIGKPVEINALWFNALSIGAALAQKVGDLARVDHWRDLASKSAASFNSRFWNGERECLHDVVDLDYQPGTTDGSLRPNQLLAISLTYPALDSAYWVRVVETCERELLTPMGLRTLARGDVGYVGRYEGDLARRDHAYHQGTVWPWLLGPFITAYVRAHGATPSVRKAARRLLTGIESHLAESGIGSVSEVADGDPPHRPDGCPWQAWSVAEPLRALCEDVLAAQPVRIENAPAVRRLRQASSVS